MVDQGGRPASRILVVDDDESIRAFVVRSLQAAGHEVYERPDGLAGLAAARLHQPDLVLLDWMMPNMTGAEVCVAVRSDPALQHLPVIFLTSRTEFTDAQHGFAVGADDYLVKPFVPVELVNRVDALLHREQR